MNIQLLLGFLLRLLLGDLLADFFHIERAHLRDELIESIPRERPWLAKEEDSVSEDHQGRDRRDSRCLREGAFGIGVDLGECEFRVLLTRGLKDRCELATRATPCRPEIDKYRSFFGDESLEFLTSHIDGRHATQLIPWGYKCNRRRVKGWIEEVAKE